MAQRKPRDQPSVKAPDTLTAGEIAERLAKLAPDVTATRARVKFWAREGLLASLDEKYPGVGRHRQFGPEAVIDAAILTTLADAGVRIAGRSLLYALSLARELYRDIQKRKGAGAPKFLEIAIERGKPAVAFPHTGSVKPVPTAEISIIVNMSQLYTRLGEQP